MGMVLVLGLGNPLLGDDGTGIRVIQTLRREGLPEGVMAVTAGGNFYSYWDLLLKSRFVIAVDSMLGGGEPGTIYLLSPEQVEKETEWGIRHEVHFLDVLKMAAFHGAEPEVTVIGVEPKNLDFSLELSPEILIRLPEIINLVKSLCQRIKVSGEG